METIHLTTINLDRLEKLRLITYLESEIEMLRELSSDEVVASDIRLLGSILIKLK